MNIYLVAVIIGGIFLFAALWLLYKKRITLDSVLSRPTPKRATQGASKSATTELETVEAMKLEIGKLVSVRTNVPALGLFIIGSVMVWGGLFYWNAADERDSHELRTQLKATRGELVNVKSELKTQLATLTVTGTVTKKDSTDSPRDVLVEVRWPPFYPDGDGKLTGLVVERDSKGRLPVLAFLHDDYEPVAVDLNTEATVVGSAVVIPDGRLDLRRIPGHGDNQ